MAKLDAKALGLALGIVWSASLVVMAVLVITINYGAPFVDAMSKFYLGYDTTARGIVIGAIWGFLDAGIGGLVIAWLYNKLAK